MSMTRIAVTGALGRMGTLVIQEATKKSEDMELVAGFDIQGAGKMLLGDVRVSEATDLNEVLTLTKPDVLIDFTICTCRRRKLRVLLRSWD